MKNKRKEIEVERDQRFLEEFGMTYKEFDELDLHTQLELISQKREEKKKESLGRRLIHKIKKH